MVLDPIKLLQYTIDKEMKISHLDDCKAVICKKENIPADIMQKISNQYDEKFTDDADIIMFVKGPIDKKKVDKIFKCSDRAFGAEANLMTVGDFKLLKMNDSDGDIEDIEDDGDETPDSEIDNIVNSDNEETQEQNDTDVNSEALDNALDDTSDETSSEDVENVINNDSEDDTEEDDSEDDTEEDDTEEDDTEEDDSEDDTEEDDTEEDDTEEVDESLNEAGISPEQMMAQFAKRKEAEEQKKAEDEEAKKQQKIKEIWIKEINLDKDIAKLQLTYVNGKEEDIDFDISTTGSYNSNGKDISQHQNGSKYYAIAGEKYKQQDKLYKDLEQNLKKGKGKPGCLPRNLEVTDEDVRISMVKVAFNDWRIKWFYGKDKKTEPWFAFSRPEDPQMNIQSKTSFRSYAGSQAEKTARGKPIYQNGNTKIYRVGEAQVNEDDADEKTNEQTPTLPTKFVFIKITMKK